MGLFDWLFGRAKESSPSKTPEPDAEVAAEPCPRCGKPALVEKASQFVKGRKCTACKWAAVWCHACNKAPMKATPEVWDKPGMPLQAWLECKSCGKRSRADYGIIAWLQKHGAL
jgi:hypothetical protein